MFQKQTEEVLNFLKENSVINIGGFNKMRGANNPTPIMIDYHRLYQPDVTTFVAEKMVEKILHKNTDCTKIACSVQGNVIAYEVAKRLNVPLLMLSYINFPYYAKPDEDICFIRDVIETGRGSARAIEKITRRDICPISVMCVFDYRMHLATKIFAPQKMESGGEGTGIQIQSLININHLVETEPAVKEWVTVNKHLFGKGNRYIPGQS
jgi:orotate phosphoribosyltransferase